MRAVAMQTSSVANPALSTRLSFALFSRCSLPWERSFWQCEMARSLPPPRSRHRTPLAKGDWDRFETCFFSKKRINCHVEKRDDRHRLRKRATTRSSGQSTVEASLLLPLILILLALLLEPVCLFYTRSVMEATASELCRLLATRTANLGDEDIRNYALERLHAIPETTPFHKGGDGDWEISASGTEGSSTTEVSIRGHVPLLPFYSAVANLLGAAQDGAILLTVKVKENVRPSWLSGSYSDWVSMWEGS